MNGVGESLLIVDDEPAIGRLEARMLERYGYRCVVAATADEARALLEHEEFSLMLCDVDMPGESGIDLVAAVLEERADLAAVMVTGMDDLELAERSLEIGAYGYVIKPFRASELLINVANALRRRALERENRAHRGELEETVAQRTAALRVALEEIERSRNELRGSWEEAIRRLTLAAKVRDEGTGRHLERMSRYCGLLAQAVGLGEERAELLRLASPLHDVGKIAMPDSVLRKPGPLTAEERRVIETHPEIGYSILAGSGGDLLELAARIALTHHERVDGSGYPHGLAGDEIPLEGRIAAVADVFDALTSDRVYRPALDVDAAVELMRAGRGTKFDAGIFDLFLERLDEVREIRSALADPARVRV